MSERNGGTPKSGQRIVYVNGQEVRTRYCMDFGIIAERYLSGHAPSWYVPEGECWIEQRLKDETAFLLETEAAARRIYAETPDYRSARAALKAALCTPLPNGLEAITMRRYACDGFLVRELDGGAVRRHFDPHFVMGGHWLVYPDYLPEGEIWVDAKMYPDEMPETLMHERVELKLMQRGLDYDTAHNYAIAANKEMRRARGLRLPGDEDAACSGTAKDRPMIELLLDGL